MEYKFNQIFISHFLFIFTYAFLSFHVVHLLTSYLLFDPRAWVANVKKENGNLSCVRVQPDCTLHAIAVTRQVRRFREVSIGME